MPEVANIYDSGPISPFARINDKIAVWSENKYIPFKILWYEGLPASSPFVVDLVTIAGLTSLPAAGTIQKQAIPVLQMNENELLHLRWEPLDDVEGGLWQLSNMARYNPFGAQLRVSPFTRENDPYLATTTFFVLGRNKDVNIGAFNPWAVPQPTARFAFWGFRYILEELPPNENRSPITLLPVSGR